MALYEDLQKTDVIRRVAHMFKPNGPFAIDIKTYRIRMDRMIPITTPWVYVKHPAGNRCDKNFDILFNLFANDLRQPPIRCQDCWKVVVRPQTVTELIKLYELQYKLVEANRVYGCKCGIEIRQNVNALYGGYFYNRGIKAGKKCQKLVKDEVTKQIGEHVHVFLKRGCTEMEVKFGDSEKWQIGENQATVEANILKYFDFPKTEPIQPEFVQSHVMASWIEFACDNGDGTYREHTDTPLHATYRHYEGEK